jgi:acetoin utilization deacetylase AcuC-like enzyme
MYNLLITNKLYSFFRINIFRIFTYCNKLIMREKGFKIFYTPEMIPKLPTDFISKSPLKPRLFHDAMLKQFGASIETVGDFAPFDEEHFRLAHTEAYVKAFLNGEKPLCETSGIPWSESLVKSVCLTNSSLYHAIRSSIDEPSKVSVSPTSGFHHAYPGEGYCYCTFSGQVIASTMLYRERGLVGAYIDLDAHYGNSIEDSREFVVDLNRSVPVGCNVNLSGKTGEKYIKNLEKNLRRIGKLVLSGDIDYVVFCHGADSHLGDDFEEGVCTTGEWLHCSRVFYKWVKEMDEKLGKPLPLTTCLFGGYKHRNFPSVISLHVNDHRICEEILMQ